jgi:hypothetical protein
VSDLTASSGSINLRNGKDITLDNGQIHGVANGTSAQDAVAYSQIDYANMDILTVAESGDSVPIYDESTQTYKRIVMVEEPLTESFVPDFTGFTVASYTARKVIANGVIECWITAVLNSVVTSDMVIGMGNAVDSGYPAYGWCGEVTAQDSDNSYAATMGYCYSSSGWYGVSLFSPSQTWHADFPITWASGDIINLHFRLPLE